MKLTKTYTDSDSKITHVEISISETEGDTTVTASDIFELREPVDSIDEKSAIKSIGIWWSQIAALQQKAKTKLSLASHTEATV